MHGVPSVPSAGSALKTRRFVTLDAMRGVAALVVAFYHSGQNLGGYTPRFGYLAVDVFFVLSGFVLARAYDKRLGAGMTTWSFMRIRCIRLFPLAMLGIALGVLTRLVQPTPFSSAGGLSVAAVANGLLLPSPVFGELRSVFPLNPPFWSLFFELWVANLLFAALWSRLRGLTLYSLIAICAVAMLISEKEFYTINVGWGAGNFFAGFPRVGLSFFAGVAISRLHAVFPSRVRTPSIIIMLGLLLTLTLPLEARLAHGFELLCVLVLFPALVYFGAEAFETQPILGAILGDASYALYTIHVPILMLLAEFTFTRSEFRGALPRVALIVALASSAWLLAQYDERVRGLLTKGSKASTTVPS